ncbi:MAG: hypothetical protein O2782_18915, partial [bacterium]|nr:hypothetical protein [bacterium]
PPQAPPHAARRRRVSTMFLARRLFDIGRDAWRALSPAQKAERLDEVRGIYDRITQSFLNSENGVSTVNLMEYETRVIEKGDYDEWLK